MNIYIDLDETLIHAKLANNGNPGTRTPIKLVSSDGSPQEVYYSLLRPGAKKLLKTCRNLFKEVKILTTATRDYALLHNEVFSLGFEPHKIIAREDYLSQVVLAYGSTTEPVKYNVDPNSILIDNLPRLSHPSMLKQQYLGVKAPNYIEIREYTGKDPKCFDNELDQILKHLEHRVNENQLLENKTSAPNENEVNLIG
jgi:hypothetical protein